MVYRQGLTRAIDDGNVRAVRGLTAVQSRVAIGAGVALVAVAAVLTFVLRPGEPARNSANRALAPTGTTGSPATVPVPTTTAPAPTSTPTPSRTTAPVVKPPDPNQKGCAPRPGTCGFPDAASTGVAAGTSLTVVNGNVDATGAVENKEIRGCVEVHAANVTIRNTRILGNGCFTAVRNFSTGLRLENVEITCGNTGGTGIGSQGFTLLRSNVYGCENGMDVSGAGNVTVQDSYIHDLFFGPGAHTDGAQFGQGASNITFQHNSIIMSNQMNAAIIMWDEVNPQNQNVLIASNLFNGGGYTLYCPRMNASAITIVSNRFGTHNYGTSNGCVSGHVTQFANNVNDADGTPVQGS